MQKLIMILSFIIITMISSETLAYDSNIDNGSGIKITRNYLKNSGDERIARNLLVVKKVADFKIGDEKYAKYFETVENTREFDRKMEKALSVLSNSKMRNSKNKEVIQILNEAGDKLYNLLAN